jgi:hypothetical protein
MKLFISFIILYLKSPYTPSFVTLFLQNILRIGNIHTGGNIEKGGIPCTSTMLRNKGYFSVL